MIAESFNAIPDLFFQYSQGKCDLTNVKCDGDGLVTISPMNAIHGIGYVLLLWTFPVLLATGLSVGLGSSIASVTRARRNQAEQRRLVPDDSWRGLEISLGTLPTPVWLPEVEPVKLKFSKSTQKKLKALEERHHKLFSDIIGYLHGNPDAFVGDGHKGTLLEHTLRVVEQTLDDADDEIDPLLPIAAAAHDIGKTISHYKSKSGEWVRHRGIKGNHDTQGGLLLSTMPSFPLMDEEEKTILIFLTKYAHKPHLAPYPTDDIRDRMLRLFAGFRGADKTVTASEKAEVIEDRKTNKTFDESILEAFFETITTYRFQEPNLPKNRRAIGWRKGDQLILIEIEFREKFATVLPADILSAWGGVSRRDNTVADLTKNLLAWFDEKGWLVKEIDVYKTADDAEPFKHEKCPEGHLPIWSLFSGQKSFKGVWAVNIPEEYRNKLPNETQFDLKYYGYMKPPKKDNRSQRKATSSAQSKLMNKRRANYKEKEREAKAFEEQLSKQPEKIQERFRKQRSKFHGIGNYSVSDQAILDSILNAEKTSKQTDQPAKEPDRNAPTDRRAQLDGARQEAKENDTFKSLTDDQKKAARKLVSQSLNNSKSMSLESAAKVVLGETSETETVSGPKYKTAKAFGSTSDSHRSASELPRTDAFEPGTYASADDETRSLANKLVSKSLNSGTPMSRDEAAKIVIDGAFTADDVPEKSQRRPSKQDTAQTQSKSDSERDNKPNAKSYWATLNKKQRRQAMLLVEKEISDGNRSPDRESIARSVIDVAGAETEPEKDVANHVPKQAKSGKESPSEDKPSPGRTGSGNAQNSKNTSTEEGKPGKRTASEASPAQSEEPGHKKREEQTGGGHSPVPKSANEPNGASSEGAFELTDDERKMVRKKMSEALNNGRRVSRNEIEKEVLALRESEAPFQTPEKCRTEPAPEKKGGGDAHRESASPDTNTSGEQVSKPKRKRRRSKRPQGHREVDAPNKVENLASETKDSGLIPGQADLSKIQPFVEVRSEFSSSIGAAIGKSGEAALMDKLTHRELIQLRRELTTALNNRLTGKAVNRAAIAERIIANRRNATPQVEEVAPEIKQYQVVSSSKSDDSV